MLHEYSAALNIIEAVARVAREHGARRVVEIAVELGALSFISPENLKLAFEIASEGTIAHGAKLHVDSAVPIIKCEACGYNGSARYEGPEYHYWPISPSLLRIFCPKCGSLCVPIGGYECIIKSVKLEL